ncbi:MAG TPA: DUF2017 family protein [Verrucomicrobiae bacterium]|nr:DUF2017 family protein [Verrucomicrobiae bacterium]
MNALRVRAVNQKQLCISGIDPLMAVCLQELPQILELRDRVRARLFPSPTTDDAIANREWQESITPELRHLFVSAGEAVARDLTRLKPTPRNANCSSITFPAAHRSAWMSALNQARLILSELFGVDEIDMNVPYHSLGEAKGVAVIKIDLFGTLLHRLVQRELNSRPRNGRKRPKHKRQKRS